MTIALDEEFAGRFWARVAIRPGCWEWTGALSNGRYGGVEHKGTALSTHRVAYELANNETPGPLWVLHRCDNPRCCNPLHLFLGSNKDNVADRHAKGRSRGGRYPKSPNMCRLTGETVKRVRELCAAGEKQKTLAATLGVDPSTINDIVLRRTWRHI